MTVAVAGVLSWLLAGRTLRPIRDNMAARERFFAQAAHDLRTPLAVMRTEAEVALQRGELSGAETARLIGSQVEEIGRLSLLVERGAPRLLFSRGHRALRNCQVARNI